VIGPVRFGCIPGELAKPVDPGCRAQSTSTEPYAITNIKGMTAMGYTMGHATDSAGNAYQVITDLRVFQGDYVGARSTFGRSASARAHGSFVLI
jgi:hypothetical protein